MRYSSSVVKVRHSSTKLSHHSLLLHKGSQMVYSGSGLGDWSSTKPKAAVRKLQKLGGGVEALQLLGEEGGKAVFSNLCCFNRRCAARLSFCFWCLRCLAAWLRCLLLVLSAGLPIHRVAEGATICDLVGLRRVLSAASGFNLSKNGPVTAEI